MEFSNSKIHFEPTKDGGLAYRDLSFHEALQIVDHMHGVLKNELSAASARDTAIRKAAQRYSGHVPLPIPCEASPIGEQLCRIETLRQDIASLAMETT